ncbi:MAG: ankyrin repeat domain-containing protein [Acidobacteria bacterium]|nr:ankyrin repeat domain-containing protein [Acidobacteriota bacterium]
MKRLLEAGAKADVMESRSGQTALMWAAAEGNAEITKMLLEKGAPVSTISKKGYNALLFAAQGGNVDTVKALIAGGAETKTVSPDGATPFLIALSRGHESVAMLMLNYGVDINGRDKNGSTPLHEAVQQGKIALVKELVSRGADLKAQTAVASGRGGFFRVGGLTPFLTAAQTGNVEMMKTLIGLGASAKEKNPEGINALVLASFARKLAPIQFLVEAGVDVNETRKGDGGVLHAAIRFGLNDVIEYLVAKGVDLNVKDRFGRSPLEEAEFEAPKPTIELMRKLTAAQKK